MMKMLLVMLALLPALNAQDMVIELGEEALLVNQKPTSLPDLAAAIEPLRDPLQSAHVLLRVEPRVPYERMLALLQQLRALQIGDVRLELGAESAPRPEPPAPETQLRLKLQDSDKGLEILVLEETRLFSSAQLLEHLQDGKPRPIVVDVEPDVPYQAFLQVLDVLESLGLSEQMSLATSRGEPGALSVLLLARSPTWEARYLKNYLQRAEGFQLDYVLESADPEFPQEVSQGYPDDLSGYDVIILGNPQLALAAERLAAFVQAGGGLIWLPPGQGQEFAGNLHPELCPARLQPEVAGGIPLAPLTLLAGEDIPESWAQLWPETLPLQELSGQLHCAFKVTLNESAQAPLLARWGGREDAQPFVALASSGQGRLLFLGAEDTWRWRGAGGDQPLYGPFWQALLRWAASR